MNTLQQQAFNSAIYGHSVFITGPAGTGKSYLMNHIIEHLHKRGKKVAVTSLTGVSASLLDSGQTFHSWLGIKYIPNMDDMSYPQLRDTVIKGLSQYNRRKIRDTQVLIIDEISMMPFDLLTLLHDVTRAVRKSIGLIGGIQVIALGDFHQLPPVKYKSYEEKYVFQNPLWKVMFPRNQTFVLNEIVRQKDDELFRNILSDIRNGRLRLEYERLLCQKIKPLTEIADTIPRLYAMKKDIDEMNMRRLEQMSGESRTITATLKAHSFVQQDTFNFPRDTLISENLVIKVGALVMFNKNIFVDIERTMFIPNGKCGIVVELADKRSGYPVVEYEDERGQMMRYVCKPETWTFPHYSITQIPIMLAWNISIHKSQGSTLDKVAIDIGDTIFEYGQMYVALSRCRSFDGLTLIKFQPRKLKTDPLVKEYYRRLYSDEDTFSNDEKKEERKSETESPKSSKPSSPKNAPASDDASGAMEMDNGRLSATHSKNYHAFFRQFVHQGTSGTNVAKKTG
jgi:ATP-dependent DNA helicase PIF1